MKDYIWGNKEWPNFYWDRSVISLKDNEVFYNEGFLKGVLSSFEKEYMLKHHAKIISTEIEKSWKIEDENLDKLTVYSSVCRKLNIEDAINRKHSSHIDGIVEITLDAIDGEIKTLDSSRLFDWNSKMFPNSKSGGLPIKKGQYRENPIDVIAGEYGKEKVVYTAVPNESTDGEMEKFFSFVNNDMDYSKFVKSAIAHLWFATIHPFEDGNGRLARAISDFVLYQNNKGYSFYSISAQIKLEQKEYYREINKAQTNSCLDITEWIIWYLDCLNRSIIKVTDNVNITIKNEKFFRKANSYSLNKNQLFMIGKIIDERRGKITTKKWAKICSCSHDTATRDLNDLIKKGLFKKISAGPNTSYELIY
jgi:Fic family protein